MKKILLFLALLLVSAASSAQTDEHLKFMGMPINGKIMEFQQALAKKGFFCNGTDGNTISMHGAFADNKDCNVIIMCSQDTKVVYSVSVIFPADEDWNSLYGRYSLLKKNLTEKYANDKVDCAETFSSTYQKTDNSLVLFHAVKSGDCNYSTTIIDSLGVIRLQISNAKKAYDTTCFVSLVYLDGVNGLNENDKIKDDL